MIHKFQEREDYNDNNPEPYQGGYDQAASYGAIKPADKAGGYPRSQFGVEAPVAQYGNERNPYERGHPGPSTFGGSPKPGAVYGGGRDRSQPSPEEAQPDKGVKTGSGRREPANGQQPELINSTPPHIQEEDPGDNKPIANYEVSEESGYRKLKSIYDQDEQSKPPFTYAEAAEYRRPYFGYGEAASGNHHKSVPTFSDVDQYGYRSLFYGHGEAESSYRNSYYGYTEEDSGYHKPQPTYYNDEASVYRKPHNEEEESKPGPIYREEMVFSRTTSGEGAYSGFAYGYGYQPNYGEETSGYGHGGYGGYGGYWPKSADDDPSRFGGGSAYEEERVQNPPAPAPAYRSSWW